MTLRRLAAALGARPGDRGRRRRPAPPRMSRSSLPFLVAALSPFALVALEPAPLSVVPYLAALALAVGLLTFGMLAPWRRLPGWAHVLPALGYLGVIALLRHAEAGTSGVIAAMALLPVLWTATHGTRGDVMVVLLGLVAVFDIPVILYGEDRYAGTDVVHGFVLTVIGGALALGVQRIMTGLQRVDDELRTTVSGALDGFVSVGADGRIVAWTPRSSEILGWTAPEVIGRRVSEIIPSLSHPTMAGRPDGAVAAFAVHRSGRQVPVHVSRTQVTNRDGSERVNLFVQDSTERKRVLDALIATENRFQTMFEHAPIGTALVDLTGTVVMANEAWCEVFAASRPSVERAGVMSLIHPADAGDAAAAFAAVTEQADLAGHEYRMAPGDAGERWVQIHQSLIRDAAGEPEFVLAHAIDVTDRRRFEQQLHHQANHDPLTGLLNRRGFAAELERQVALSRRYGPTGALVMLDLDGFKHVNDTLGHSAGDDLIITIGRALRSRLRETDVLARLGGDEFAVILLGVDSDEAALVAGDIAEAVRTAGRLDQPLLRPVTASVGVVAFSHGDATAEDLMMRADLAMYDAKERGKDRVAVWQLPEDLDPSSTTRLAWIDQLKDALDHERFVLEAQPIIDLRSGRITEYELLIRLPSEDGELVPPGTFLYLAERYDLITDIDRWVTKQAIAMLADRKDIPADVGLTVNLSGRSIACAELADDIAAELRRTGVDPQRLTFELTETTAVADVPAARRFAERLSALGCQFALDDFGAGFGSFYYLKHLPVDRIKIDGEFVRNCVQNRSDQVTIESVVHLARGLGKRTVAEYVTDPETCTMLIELGVDGGQGFHFGRPQSLGDPMDARYAPGAEQLPA